MASDLAELLSPVRVRDVILPHDGDGARFEAEVRRAILFGVGTNADYRWECVQVWSMCYLSTKRGDEDVDFDDVPARLSDGMLARLARKIYDGDRDPAVMGLVVSELGSRWISDHATMTELADEATDAENRRLMLLLKGCAAHCPFDKRGDAHLHTLIRLLLPAWEEAAVGEAVPFDAMDRHYAKDVSIRLVRPLFERMPSERAADLDFSSGDGASLALLCGIVGEHLDDTHMDVLVNGRFLTRPAGETGMFAFRGFGGHSDGIGIYCGSTLQYASRHKWPLCSVVKAWARSTPGAVLLWQALTTPSELPVSSSFKRMLEGN